MKKIFCLLTLLYLTSVALAQENQGVAVQLFGWSWRDIGKECAFLHKAGYSIVKIDPPNEYSDIEGNPWWAHYQPVTYQLNKSQGGKRVFVKMLQSCHQHHIRVVADVVLNHMAIPQSNANNLGINGTTFSKNFYPHILPGKRNITYTLKDFHHLPNSNINCVINFDQDLKNRQSLLYCSLFGLPDLNQDSLKVYKTQRQYLQNLLKLGIDGFRVDAASYIPADYLTKLFKDLITNEGQKPYISLEITNSDEDAVKPNEYYSLGLVTQFAYDHLLWKTFGSNSHLSLQDLIKILTTPSFDRDFPSEHALVFIDNHDTEREKKEYFNLIEEQPRNYTQWVFANAFLLTWPYGHPRIYSSYEYINFDAPSPQEPAWVKGKALCYPNSPWLCQHRIPIIIALVGFYNRMQQYHANKICHLAVSGNTLSFARCDKHNKVHGYIVMNYSAKVFNIALSTGLAHDQHHAFEFSDEQLIKKTISISHSGQLNRQLAPMSFLIIYS